MDKNTSGKNKTKKRLSQNCQLVVELVETTSDYQPDTHFDRLSVQINTDF